MYGVSVLEMEHGTGRKWFWRGKVVLEYAVIEHGSSGLYFWK
jgi:hypothetical protein